MSIKLQNRDYTDPLNQEIQNLLNSISDFEFTMPNGLVFKMSDVNEKVPVYLDKSESRPEEHKITWKDLNNRIDELEDECEWLMVNQNKTDDDFPLSERLWDLIEKLKRRRDDYENAHPRPDPDDIVLITEEITLLGYYTRDGRDHNSEIVLLMETLGNESRCSESVAITLIHEMFHAFYDHDLNESDTYVPFVEEPLTEYAMLKFVEALEKKDKQYNSLLNKAKEKVFLKQFSSAVAHYGFGCYLWKYENENRNTLNNIHWIEAFRDAKYRISESTLEYMQYAEPFSCGIYPFDDEYLQMELLRRIVLNNITPAILKPSMTPLAIEPSWRSCGRAARFALENDTLYLDGAFLHVRTFSGNLRLSEYVNTNIKQIVLWDHFICDDFDLIKKILHDKNAKLRLSPHNFYYVKKDGAIYDKKVTALFYLSEMKTIYEIPDTVTRITPSALLHCDRLTEIHFQKNNVGMSKKTFCDCESLSCLTLSNGTNVNEVIYQKRLLCVSKDPSITSYTIPADVGEIDEAAFCFCGEFLHLEVGDNITEIPNGLLKDCNKLQSVRLGNGVWKIGSEVFNSCDLKEITLPANLKELSRTSFWGCRSLQKLTFTNSNPPEILDGDLIPAKGCIIHVPSGSHSAYKKLFPDHTVVEY